MNICCFGDSNTYGYDPRSYFGGRYDEVFRWVDIVATETGWNVHNEGENGRRIPRCGFVIPPQTDLLTVMLGTNDLLQGCSAEETACKMEEFLTSFCIAPRHILLIAPPPLVRGAWVTDGKQILESTFLSCRYREIAERMGIDFTDAGAYDVDIAFDGVHFTEMGHQKFAAELLRVMKEKYVQ